MIRSWRTCLASLLVVSCSRGDASERHDSGYDAGAERSDASAPIKAGLDAGGGRLGGRDLIASADGDDSAPGTLARPTTLLAALDRVAPGGTVYLRGGTYELTSQLTIARDNRGSPANPKTLAQYQREAPILDFSQQPYGREGNPRGIQLEGSYWRLVGLIVRGAADSGIYVAGDHNSIERCATFQNRGAGLQLGPGALSGESSAGPSDNQILNCESFDNADGPPGSGANAAGFGAHATGPRNVFRGCVSHHNLGDGWDLSTEAAVTIDRSVAHTNCYLTDGTHDASRECSGFDLGGEGAIANHIVARSIAYHNDRNGFAWSGTRGALRLIHTLAFDNAQGNYWIGAEATMTDARFANNVSVWVERASAQDDRATGLDEAGSNRFWREPGSGVASSDFTSMLRNVMLTRDPEGDLILSAFAPAPASALVDTGVVPDDLPFEATYYHRDPDLGAVEAP